MNSNTEVLCKYENGVEYFTDTVTGDSGMSQIGLARACGKRHFTIQKLVKNLANKQAPGRLKRFIGKDLTLPMKPIKNGGEAIVYKADFCAAVIKHYAYLGSEKAQDIDDAIGAIGLTSYIQGKTGYLPTEFQSAPEARESINRILDCPEPWTLMFEGEFEQHLTRLTGYHKNHIRNSHFYWEFIYSWMLPEEKEKLDRVNPVCMNGRRRFKIHQMLDKATKDRLKPHIQALMVLMRSARSVNQLKHLMACQYGEEQANLIDLLY